MKKGLFIILALFVFFTVTFNKEALSWVESTTHRSLSEFAALDSVLGQSNGDYLRNLGFNKELLEEFKWNDNKRTVKDWIQEGAELEDKSALLFPVLGKSRSVNHFHNPLKPWSIAGLDDTVLLFRYTGQSSLLWSQDGSNQQNFPEADWSWRTIRNYYYLALTSANDSERQTNFAKTFKGLGHQIHLIQDGTQPDHVRNNAHPWDTTGLKRWIGIEKWANDNPTFIISLASDPNVPKNFSPQVSFDVSYNDLVPITQLFDALKYSGGNPSKSLDQGVTEYTNANFFSDGTIFAAERYPTNHGHYFPHPKRGSTDLQSYINGTKPSETIIIEDGLEATGFWISKENDGETVNHFLRAGLLTRIIYKLLGEGDLFYSSFYRDEECHKDYSRKLIPRAVGYSAGLLNYFFRGQLDVQQSDTKPDGKIEITITNLSDDTLVAGEFELYYDNNNGGRQKITDLSPNSVANLRKYNPTMPETMFKATFSAPTNFDPEKKGKYMLVYRGKLGKEDGSVEEGAVIGKYASIGKVLPVMATYDFGLNKIFFKGNGLKAYIDLNGIVDNCHDGPDYLRGQPYEGVTDRRVLWVMQAASISYLKAFSLLEENGIYGAFVTGLSTLYGEYSLESESSYKAYKFKLTSKSAGNETYTWVYSDTNYTDRDNPYCQPDHVYTNFTVTDTYDKYDFDWTVEDLPGIPDMSHPGVVSVRGFKVYSKVGMDLLNLGQLKYAIGGTFRDSETGDKPSPSLFWYDSGETVPAWHSILTGCSLDQYSDIYNCAFAISGGLHANEITDVVVVWTQGHYTKWPISGIDYWDWYVTDKNGDHTYLYRENSTRPPYNVGATFGTWVDMDRKGGGIKNDATDRIQIIAGAVDWFNAGKGFYRINGRWYSEDSVPSQYLPEGYPFGAIRGKELTYSTMRLGELKCPVVDEKSIAWSREWCLGMHHTKGFRYRTSYQNYDHSMLAPTTYYYGKVYEQSSILGYSRPFRPLIALVWTSYINGEWVPTSYDLIDYWNFISDFAVISSGE